MVMPGPIGRQNQIAFFHVEFFAVHCGIRACALHDETDRRHIMAVGSGHLAGIHDGKGELKRVRGRLDRQMRTDKTDGAPLRLFDTDGLTRLEQAVEERLPLPQIRRLGRCDGTRVRQKPES